MMGSAEEPNVKPRKMHKLKSKIAAKARSLFAKKPTAKDEKETPKEEARVKIITPTSISDNLDRTRMLLLEKKLKGEEDKKRRDEKTKADRVTEDIEGKVKQKQNANDGVKKEKNREENDDFVFISVKPKTNSQSSSDSGFLDSSEFAKCKQDGTAEKNFELAKEETVERLIRTGVHQNREAAESEEDEDAALIEELIKLEISIDPTEDTVTEEFKKLSVDKERSEEGKRKHMKPVLITRRPVRSKDFRIPSGPYQQQINQVNERIFSGGHVIVQETGHERGDLISAHALPDIFDGYRAPAHDVSFKEVEDCMNQVMAVLPNDVIDTILESQSVVENHYEWSSPEHNFSPYEDRSTDSCFSPPSQQLPNVEISQDFEYYSQSTEDIRDILRVSPSYTVPSLSNDGLEKEAVLALEKFFDTKAFDEAANFDGAHIVLDDAHKPFDGTRMLDNTQKPFEGTHMLDNTQKPFDGTLILDNTQKPFVGTHMLDTTQKPFDGTHMLDTMQKPFDGTHMLDTTQKPFDGTHMLDTTQKPYDGTHMLDNTQKPFDGTHMLDNTQKPFDGTHMLDSTQKLFDGNMLDSEPKLFDGAHMLDNTHKGFNDSMLDNTKKLLDPTYDGTHFDPVFNDLSCQDVLNDEFILRLNGMGVDPLTPPRSNDSRSPPSPSYASPKYAEYNSPQSDDFAMSPNGRIQKTETTYTFASSPDRDSTTPTIKLDRLEEEKDEKLKRQTPINMSMFKKQMQALAAKYAAMGCCQKERAHPKEALVRHLEQCTKDQRSHITLTVARLDIAHVFQLLYYCVLPALESPAGAEGADVAREHANCALVSFACQRLLAEKPELFLDEDYGLALLSRAAVRCPTRPELARYIVWCIRRALSTRPPGAGPVFTQTDAAGDNLAGALARLGDSHAGCLAEIASRQPRDRPLLDLEHRNTEGYSALHLACQLHNSRTGPHTTHTVHVLMAHGGVPVTLPDNKSGNTALHCAVDAGGCDLQLVLTLFQDVPPNKRRSLAYCKNAGMKTPIELARCASRTRADYPTEVLDFLKKCRT